MFAEIAPRYDRLNHLLSVGLDRRWRRVAVNGVLDGLDPGLRVLDVCCGTGDLAAEFSRRPAVDQVVGADFVEPMVRRAREKYSPPGTEHRWLVGDAMQLPLTSERFDVVSVAFGLRNLVDPAAGLREFARVLKPGGRLVVLEFFPPPAGVAQRLFRAYFHHVLPRVGRLFCPQGQFDAYRYLPESVESFARPDTVERWMQDAGLRPRAAKRLTLGTVVVLSADREAKASVGAESRRTERRPAGVF